MEKQKELNTIFTLMWKRNNMVLLSLEYWLYPIFYFIPRLEKLRKKK